jgi:cob(I)alamin adenosyltransferase
MRHSLYTSIKALTVACAFGAVTPALAVEPFETKPTPFLAIDETRIGVFKQAIDDAPGEGGAALNLEVLTGRIPSRGYENRILDFFLTPRVHVGTTIAFGKTSQLYSGFTWDFKLTDRFFAEASFGGAIHDGPLNELHRASYGCVANFRESGSIGMALNEDWRLMLTLDHMSNAGLCDTNRGLTNLGLRLGYKW